MQAPPDVFVMELLPEPAEAWAFIERRCADAPDVPLIILTSLIRPDRSHRRKARARVYRLRREAMFAAATGRRGVAGAPWQPGAGDLDLRRVGH